MAIFELKEDSNAAIRPVTFAEPGLRQRNDLQRFLRDDVDLIARKVLIVSHNITGTACN